MIIKKRKSPLIILKLQALQRRLPDNHPKVPQITEELKKRMAGYRGELAADYQLSLYSQDKQFIFQDLRLPSETSYFQMDTLLITSKYAIILEIKNIAGTIFFEPNFNQLIRTKDGQETAFADPILQTERLQFLLKQWFLNNGFPHVPIFSLVVISNPQTIIQSPHAYQAKLAEKIIHCEKLPLKIKKIESDLNTDILTEKELRKLKRISMKEHSEADFPILDRFGLTHEDLLKGVFCPVCILKMERYKGGWYCLKCQNKYRNAHLEALNDYKLLISSTITNKEIRDYLQLVSPSSATKLLHSLNLKSTGQNKGRVYELYLNEKSTP
ncbi:nuclease-related domain-containing protein [Metabacillus sp. FJAT-52054]|uniref:Nuclease-related domain-containing protein n=1 Tax=Metabacillus sediminis TaxID=3117746 RepID=A0ABZ2NGR9_9BACI